MSNRVAFPFAACLIAAAALSACGGSNDPALTVPAAPAGSGTTDTAPVADETTVVTEHSEDWHFAPDHVVTLPFVSVQVLADGKIALWRDYSNIDTLLGAAPSWWLDHVTAAWAEA